jgi:hypothetical protein
MPRSVGAGLIALFLAACSSSTGPKLSVEGRSTIVSQSPLTVHAVVTVRNTGSQTTNINVTGCPLWLEVFTTPERSGTPVWRSGSETQACIAMAKLMALAPGDYYDFNVNATIPSLPQGRYYLAVWGANGANHVPVGQLDNF